MTLDDLDYLRGEGAALLARWTLEGPEDPLRSVQALRKLASPAQSTLIQEQVTLRRKCQRKFGPRALSMLFTRKLSEQASGPEVAGFKADRMVRGGVKSVADLCCGLGGDATSFALRDMEVHLLDADPVAVELARHNLSTADRAAASWQTSFLPDFASLLETDAFHLDPDRRTKGREQGEDRWDDKGLSPDSDGIRQIVSRFPRGAVKLPAAAPVGFLEIPGEHQYIGVHDELRELVLWTGDLARPGALSVAESRHGIWEEYSSTQADAEDAFAEDPAETPLEWIHEPVKALVRSHLFAAWGRDRGLQLLDNSMAWLTGKAAQSLLVKSYRVLAHGPLKAGSEESLLREAGRSCATVKKRGVAVVPDQMMRKLAGLPGEGATLCYLRSRGVKWVVVAEPLDRTLAETDS